MERDIGREKMKDTDLSERPKKGKGKYKGDPGGVNSGRGYYFGVHSTLKLVLEAVSLWFLGSIHIHVWKQYPKDANPSGLNPRKIFSQICGK